MSNKKTAKKISKSPTAQTKSTSSKNTKKVVAKTSTSKKPSVKKVVAKTSISKKPSVKKVVAKKTTNKVVAKTNTTAKNSNRNISDIDKVLNYLQNKKSITLKDAPKVYKGKSKLSAIIYDLRKRGHKITSIETIGKNRFGNQTRFSKYVLA